MRGSLEMQDPKNCHLGTHCTNLLGYILTTKAHIDNRKKNTLLNTNVSATCPHNMVNFGLLAAETCWRVWGIPANFNGLRVLAVLLHGTLVVGVIQALRRSTEGATYIWQGGHHVWHWPTFLVIITINSGSFCRTRLPQCSWQTKSSTSTM